jgi:hypothetical protein
MAAAMVTALAAGAVGVYAYTNRWNAENDAALYGSTAGAAFTTCQQWEAFSPATQTDSAAHLMIGIRHATGETASTDYHQPTPSRVAKFATEITQQCAGVADPTRLAAGYALSIYESDPNLHS